MTREEGELGNFPNNVGPEAIVIHENDKGYPIKWPCEWVTGVKKP